jgi:Ca2+-binding EF-hand superfamily protein
MRNLLLASAGLVLFLSACLVLAEPSKPVPKPPAWTDKAQDVVFLSEARPVLIRLHVLVDGKPVKAAWDEFMHRLFAHLDVNGDGVLSKEEAERAPSVEQLLIRGRGPFGDLGGLRVTAGPAMDALDADGDGKVTPAELAAWYRKNGLAPFHFQVNSPQANPLGLAAAYTGGGVDPSVDEVSEAVFAQLDANKDGKLTREELAAAPEVLLRLDEDEDEIVTARELVPNARPPADLLGGVGRRGRRPPQPPATGNKTLQLVLTPGQAPPDLVRFLQERYGPKADNAESKKLTRKDLGLDEATFKALDTNGDGVLDARELGGFIARSPDLALVIRLGDSKTDQPRIAADRVSPLAGKVSAQDGLAILDLGVTRLDLRRGEEPGTNFLGGSPRDQYLDQFKKADADRNGILDEKEARENRLFKVLFRAIDRDGNGKITEKELLAYLDSLEELQAQARASCVTLVLADESRGLFDLLDTNRDGRLSVREMRGATKLLEQLDRDRKGYITRTDVPRRHTLTLRPGAAGGGIDAGAAFAMLYGGGSRSEPAAPKAGPLWFRKMDRNRDGDVSRKEFLFGDELFRKIDTDGDGLISVEEAEKAAAILGGKDTKR